MTQWFPWLPPFHLPATFLTFHKVFLLLLYFLHERWPDRATSRGSHGLRRAIMVGRAAMWCGTVQIITRPAVYFHLSSLATTPASSGPRREARLIERRPPIEVNWCNVWMILLVCMCVYARMHIAIILLYQDLFNLENQRLLFEWLAQRMSALPGGCCTRLHVFW